MQKSIETTKPLGFWILYSLVVGNVIGAGIFILPASLAQYGSISLFSWGITLAGCLCLAFVFSTLNRMLPKTGGPFIYAREAFGDFLGFAVVYTYWIAWCIAIASMVLAIPGYLGIIFPIIKSNHIYPYLIEVACVWLVTAINLRGIKAVGKTQLITMILKIVPLLLIGIIGLTQFHWENIAINFVPPDLTPSQSLLGAMTITLWAFIGIESGTVPADNSISSKTISRATIFGTLTVGIIYILCTFTLMGLFPADILKQSSSPFADAAALLFGPRAAIVVAICAVIAIIGAINGGLLIQTLSLVTASRYNLGPKSFTYLRNNVPYVAFLTAGLTITALLTLSLNKSLVEQFNLIVMVSTFAFLIPYFVCSLSAFILLIRNAKQYSKSSFIRILFIILLAGIYAFWTMLGAGLDMVLYGCLFFFSALPFYGVLHWKKRRMQFSQASTQA